MRLIDADALSEKLCKTTIFVKDGEVFQRMINDAPTVSAEAVQEWIPVSEGLPKEGEPVLITDCGYVDGLAWVAKDGAWESDHAYTDSVTAWMPLPEPYKGGEVNE